ncbi:unnamed protein product [Prorocentrum cordatum]|uniref:Uncharacterized protein n=1 Tax=Prorocentrum cordatum TaxID=2364126 RepID=A0ABN9WKF5_9DINO|nr:unnamed protein product [Polarella glacialis]
MRCWRPIAWRTWTRMPCPRPRSWSTTSWATKALVYFSGFRLAVASGELGKAAPLAARARDCTILAEGRDSLYVAAFNGYAKDPASFLRDRDKWIMPP